MNRAVGRLAFAFGVIACLGIVPNMYGDDTNPAVESLAAELKAKPNDPAAWQKYLGARLGSVFSTLNANPAEAMKVLRETRDFVDTLEPDSPMGKRQKESFRMIYDRYEELIEAEQASIEEVSARLKQAPDDAKALRVFMSKLNRSVGALARTEPEKADGTLKEAKALFDSAAEAAKDDATKKLYDQQIRLFTSLEKSIESGKKLLALIGKDALPLKVEAWVNGAPLSPEDLKGKVVLLDFWAIWCGPCIATFPHLREWQEKYGEKGLVIIGLTRYYNFEWDDKAGRPMRSMTEVPHEREHVMLTKFAEHHMLKHRFAIQADNDAAEYYSVSGIPHVVLIDQQSKVRLVRVGSGGPNAKDVGDMLEKLLGAPSAATGE